MLVGPQVGSVNPKESHQCRHVSPTMEGNDVEHSVDHCIDAGKIHDNADLSPSVSKSCEDGGTTKVDESNRLISTGNHKIANDGLTSKSQPKTGGGDIEGELVGLRTPLVCPLASVGFMGYELVGSINRHPVVAYLEIGRVSCRERV